MERLPLPLYRARRALRLSPSGFLLDASNGESYSINKSGALILRALIEGRTFEDVVHEMAHAFDLSDATARRDTFRFLGELSRLGLVEPVEPDEEKPELEAPSDAVEDPHA